MHDELVEKLRVFARWIQGGVSVYDDVMEVGPDDEEITLSADELRQAALRIQALSEALKLEDLTDPAYAKHMMEHGFSMDPTYFVSCIGSDSYTPHKYGKHSATNAKIVRETLDRLRFSDPIAADVIASFVFFDTIHKNWAHFMAEEVNARARSAMEERGGK